MRFPTSEEMAARMRQLLLSDSVGTSPAEQAAVAPTLTPTLTRDDAPEPTLSTLDAQLAQDAADKLGYKIMNASIDSSKAAARLASVLRMLDIKPFTKASVDAYKQEKVQKMNIGRSPYSMGSYRWRTVTLAGYTLPVPAYVLHTALTINEKMPEANFYVDEIAWESFPANADPFLVVGAGDALYYVDVWDEPAFKGERQF